MPPSSQFLNEREFELVNILGYRMESNQRTLSQELNLSLGATNILIRRLITKGYIRAKQLNKKKIQYLLTPKGLSEKMKKSMKYTVSTIRHITLLQESIKTILLDLRTKGHTPISPSRKFQFSRFSQTCV